MKRKCVFRASFLALGIGSITLGSLALAGVFDRPPSDTCSFQLTGYGSEMVLKVHGQQITTDFCNQVIASDKANVGSGFTVKQVSAVPSGLVRQCTGTEPSKSGTVTITVYTNDDAISTLGAEAICAKLKG
jgi:hypothetical protein